jgi:hypothetical protein
MSIQLISHGFGEWNGMRHTIDSESGSRGALAEWGALLKYVVSLGYRGTTGQLHGSMISILYRELLL